MIDLTLIAIKIQIYRKLSHILPQYSTFVDKFSIALFFSTILVTSNKVKILEIRRLKQQYLIPYVLLISHGSSIMFD